MIGLPPKIFHPRALATMVAVLANGVPVAFDAIPRDVEWARNSARKADTCRLTLDYRDFPLDPRMLQAVQVRVHVDNLVDPALPFIPTPLNKRFVGLADSPEVVIGDDSTVTFECRDYTGIYLDFKWTLPIQANMNLAAVVDTIRLLVTPETLPAVFKDPTAAAKILSRTIGKNLYTPPENASAWDVLTDICALYGLVPVWNLDVLEIRTAAQSAVGNAFFVLGQNVERLTISRQFRAPASKRVLVVGWDPVAGVALEGLWPPTPPAAVGLTTAGTPKPKLEQEQYNVVGQYTPDDLVLLARRIYDEAAQRQLEGELETRDLTDHFLAPVLGLQNGDTLIVNVDPGLAVGIDGMTSAEAIAFLSNPFRQNSLSPDVAAAVVAAYEQAQTLDVTFYVKEAVHRWNRDTGYQLTVRFINFVFGAGL